MTATEPMQELQVGKEDARRVPIRMSNPSAVTRSEWEFWAQEHDLGELAVIEVDRPSGPERVPAYRLGYVGGCPVYCARPTLDPGFDSGGEMRAPKASDADLLPQVVQSHRFGPWVVDEIHTVLPRFMVKPRHGQLEVLDRPDSLTEVFSTPQVRVFVAVWTANGTPLTFKQWFYAWHDQDVVPFELHIAAGNTAAQGNSWEVEFIDMVTTEEPVLDWRRRKGLERPSFGEEGDRSWRQRLVTGPRPLGRGEMPPFSGALLCTLTWGTSSWMDNPDLRSEAVERTRNLAARRQFPFGIIPGPGAWSAQWMGCGAVPKVPAAEAETGGMEEREKRRLQMFSRWQSSADLFDVRPYGLLKHAGSTGSQDDFGATHGLMLAPVGDPMALFDLAYSVEQYALRPVHNREPDGSPVRAADHPKCRQWGHTPDPRNGEDVLGWEIEYFHGTPYPKQAPNGGWGGMDDQHRSENILWALFRVRPSFGLRDVIWDHIELDRMRVTGRAGAPRAIGRRMLAWAHAMACGTGAMARAAEELIVDLLGDVKLHGEGKAVQTLGMHHSRFIYRDGQPVLVWAVWENGLAVIGLHAALTQMERRRGSEDAVVIRLRKMLLDLCRSVVGHGMFYQGGWQQISELEWKDGAGIPHSTYTTAPNDFMSVYSPWWEWTFPSVLILLQREHDHTHFAYRKAQSIKAAMAARRSTWGNAKWDAVV